MLPRPLYGLAMLSLNKKQFDELGKFHFGNSEKYSVTVYWNCQRYRLSTFWSIIAESRDRKETVGFILCLVNSENPTLQQFWKRQYVLQHDGSFSAQ